MKAGGCECGEMISEQKKRLLLNPWVWVVTVVVGVSVSGVSVGLQQVGTDGVSVAAVLWVCGGAVGLVCARRVRDWKVPSVDTTNQK